MFGGWSDFSIIVCVQFVMFTALAYFHRDQFDGIRTLRRGIVIGVPFGIVFDLVLGKWLGVNSYVLGFTLPFLLCNAALSYGLFVATIMLLKDNSLLRLFIWTLGITATYEIANHFFTVWRWEFVLPSVYVVMLVPIGYFLGALLAIVIDRVLPNKLGFKLF